MVMKASVQKITQTWSPRSWDQIIGNAGLKRHFRRIVQVHHDAIRTGQVPGIWHSAHLLTGPSRSGKTAAVEFLVRCLACTSLDTLTLDPCDGSCKGCTGTDRGKYGDTGLFAAFRQQAGLKVVCPHLIDCTKIDSRPQLEAKLAPLRDADTTHEVHVPYFDEVHRLVKHRLDECLLKEVEQRKSMWIFSTAKPSELEDMFVNRSIMIETQLPTAEEMANWLVDRCEEDGIRWEPLAIQRVVELSNRVVGLALKPLVIASLEPEVGLTLDLVERRWKVRPTE